MKKLLAALAVTTAVALAPSTASAAVGDQSAANARYGTGSFTVAAAQMGASGCISHPYVANLNIGAETYGWFLDVTVYDPNGAVAGGYTTNVRYTKGVIAENDTVLLCTGVDIPGTYTIAGDLYTANSGASNTSTQQLTTAYFAVNPYVAPTPPPPPPAPAPPAPPATADVKGTVAKKFIERGVKLTFKAKNIPAGTVVGDELQWSIVTGDKVSSFEQKPGSTKVKTLKFRKGSGVTKVKVLRNGKVAMKFSVRA